jgi:rhamnulokinase
MVYRRTVEQLESATGKRYDRIYAVGGGTQNEQLCRMTADATGRPVIAGCKEAAAVGNALVQAMAWGEFSSFKEARECLRSSFRERIFEPRDTEIWSGQYECFCRIFGQNPGNRIE